MANRRTATRGLVTPRPDDDDPTSELQSDDPTADLDPKDDEPQSSAPQAPAGGVLNSNGSEHEAALAEAVVPRRADVGPGLVLRERYLLQQVIGSGGTSMVYRAQDLRHEAGASSMRVIAVKLLREELREDARAIERLKREFSQMQLLAHPSVLKVFDLDVDQGVWFMTMEMLEGQSLSMYLRTHRTAHPQALELIKSCTEALQFAHDRGIVHGDLKPGNIFLTGAGVRVLDFIGAADEMRTDRAATPAYASPQRLAGEIPEVCDDIYSLGCVAYEMLAGVHPFERKHASVAHELGLQPARITSVTYRQWRALDRALAFDRRDRHASMRAFAEALFHDEPKIAAVGENAASAENSQAAMPEIEALPNAGIIPIAMPAAVLTLPPQEETPEPAAQPAAAVASAPNVETDFGLRQREVLIEPLPNVEPRTPAPLPPVFEPQRRGGMLPVIIALLLAAVGLYLTRSDLEPSADAEPNEPAPAASAVSPASPAEQSPVAAPAPAAADLAPMAEQVQTGDVSDTPLPSVQRAVMTTTTKPPAVKTPPAGKAANTVGFVTSRVSVSERSVAAVIQVKRLGKSTAGRVPVRWRTEKRSAKPEEDYTEVSAGTLILQDGQRMGAIYVPIVNDDVSESDEMFVVELVDTAASAAPDIGLTIVTIRDDDRALLAANP